MKVIVDFTQDWYLIEFEPFLGEQIEKYQEEFEKWYYEEHSEIIEGKKLTCMRQRSDLPYKFFDITPIIDWMKEVAPNSKPRVIKHYVWGEKYDKSLPKLNF